MLVLNELKPRLDEKIYENALVIELERRGHCVEQQRRFDVAFQNKWVGTLVPDLIVDKLVIADPKVVSVFNDTHIAKMIGYLSKQDSTSHCSRISNTPNSTGRESSTNAPFIRALRVIRG